MPTLTPIATSLPAYNPVIAPRMGMGAAWTNAANASNQAQVDAISTATRTIQDNIKANNQAIEDAKRQHAAEVEFDRIKAEYRNSALKISQDSEKNQDIWGKLTGGFTTINSSKERSQKAQGDLQKSIDDYESKVKTYNDELVKKQQYLKDLANTAQSQEEYNTAVTEAQKWLEDQVSGLNYQSAAIQGLSEGYGKYMDAPNNSGIGQFFQAYNDKNPVSTAARWLFDHTLGSGDENLPSLTTFIGRVINTVGNTVDSGRQRNKYDGSSEKGLNGKNPWQASWNQRNFNIGNTSNSWNTESVKESDYKDSITLYKQQPKATKTMIWYKDKLPTKAQWLSEKLDNGKTRQEQYYDEGSAGLKSKKEFADLTSNVVEFLADPTVWLTGAPKMASSVPSWISKAKTAISGTSAFSKIKGSKIVSGIIKAGDKLSDSKLGQAAKWLGKEVETPKERFARLGQEYTKTQLAAQSKFMPKVVSLYDKIKNNKLDYSVFEDVAKLTDDEAAILQRMTGLNTFAARDKMAMWAGQIGKNKLTAKAQIQKLIDIQTRAQGNARLMKSVDNVASNRFDNKYWANSWVNPASKTGDKYSFKMFRKGKVGIQSAEQLKSSMVERYFQSAVDDVGNKSGKIVTQSQNQIKKLLAEYSSATAKSGDELATAFAKTKTVGDWLKSKVSSWRDTNKYNKYIKTITDNPVKTSVHMVDPKSVSKAVLPKTEKLTAQMWLNSGAKALGVPMKIWKTSVLALRPAWYVNNAAYNATAGFLTAGLDYLPESIKMMKRGALKAARKEAPDVVSKIGKYLDNGSPLWKPASALEDANRLAAYKALINKGLSKDEALKRVNKYFFSYSTKNWERPLKTLMPFWAWNKGLAGAAVRMPADSPLAARAITYNDRNNKSEVSKLPKDMQKYYADKQFLGNDKDGNPRFSNTPFNPFTSGSFSSVSKNPWLSALGELSTQKDYYGNPLDEKSISAAFLNKFPQVPLAKQTLRAWQQNHGDLNATIKYLGTVGSDGYAMTKERTGLDPKATNYAPKLDANNKLKENWLAYLGMPRGATFDKAKYAKEESLTKLNADYFKHDWVKEYPDYKERVAAQEKLASDSGFNLEKDLYNGYWAKNDSQLTKELKAKKDIARKYLNDFWTEYGNLPQDGNRNIWVKNKMKEIVDSKVILGNPFIADGLPKWFDPTSRDKAVSKEFWNKYWVASQSERRQLLADNPQYAKSYAPSQKSIDYKSAVASGDWTAYRGKYGGSAKSTAYLKAKETGDWSGYRKEFGSNPDSTKTKAASFWSDYFTKSSKERKQLLADNPEYNKFKDQAPKSKEEWDLIKAEKKAKDIARAKKNGKFMEFYTSRHKQATLDQSWANRFSSISNKKIVWKK